jgi:tRNA(His) 5'-end guanylyltransferase
MNSDSDDLGDCMKAYEAVETARTLDPALPIYARIDGRSFSTFTPSMRRPFDPRMAHDPHDQASGEGDRCAHRLHSG